MSKRIRFGEPFEPEVPIEELPPSSLILNYPGGQHQASFKVYIIQKVYEEIWGHLLETPNIESGGVLVGHPFKTFDGKITFVIVTAIIPQHSDDRSVGHFTVGPRETAQARTELELTYPGLVAVGWYHSHPGHGIFLSSQDMTIVRSIYNTSWNIALVIDPKRKREGIFVGAEGKQLGGSGYDQLNRSWISLRETPDCIKAINLYNQWKTNQDTQNNLQRLVRSSDQLKHWRVKGGYRDIAKSQKQVAPNPTPPSQQSSPTPPVLPYQPPPQPSRTSPKSSKKWLWVSALGMFLLGLFFCAAAFRITGKANPFGVLGILSFGFILSLVVVVPAWYVVSAQGSESSTFSDAATSPKQQIYSRLIPLAIIILVISSWCSLFWYTYAVGYEAVSEPSVVSPAEIATFTPFPTSTLTPIPPTNTPTAPPFPTNTPTSTPSSTDTPTSIPPTPTPAVTETFTPAAENESNSDQTTESTTLSPVPAASSTAPAQDNGNVLTNTETITETDPITNATETQP